MLDMIAEHLTCRRIEHSERRGFTDQVTWASKGLQGPQDFIFSSVHYTEQKERLKAEVLIHNQK